MKKKRFTKLLVAASLLFTLGVGSLTSCTTLFGEDGFVIQEVTWSENEKGDVVVVMNTTREDNPIITFTIPRGDKGDTGVGIKDVKTNVAEDKSAVTIIISYTDETMPDTIVTVPITHGKDGKGIVDVLIGNDELGNVTFQFSYTDGSKSQLYVIPKGNDGVGIKDISIDDSDATKVKIIISFTDESIPDKIVNLPKGIGISSVTYDPDQSNDEEYTLVVTYTDGYVETISLPRPKTNQWLNGIESPDEKQGKNGDFYLNTVSGFVYKKIGNEWQFLFSMKGTNSPIEFLVTFHPGEGKWIDPQLKDGADYTIAVKYGEYIDLNKFPTIELSGYTFNGWYTDESSNPNAGHFTDLTPVLKNMNLYPQWKLN